MKTLLDLYERTNSLIISPSLLGQLDIEPYRYDENRNDEMQFILCDHYSMTVYEALTDYNIYEVLDTNEYVIVIDHYGYSWNMVEIKGEL